MKRKVALVYFNGCKIQYYLMSQPVMYKSRESNLVEKSWAKITLKKEHAFSFRNWLEYRIDKFDENIFIFFIISST
jgi:hypothetical protein